MAALRWIETFGGPFIVVPYARRAEWQGAGDEDDDEAFDASDYGLACRATSTRARLGLVRRAGFVALALPGEPIAIVRHDDAIILVQWESGPSRPAVAKIVRALPIATLRWKTTRLRLPLPRGGLQIFDAALAGRLPRTAPRQRFYQGREIAPSKAHTVEVRAAEYALELHHHRPDDQTSLPLYRLRPTT